ncbi:hypothetical protein [Corynebacterium sp. ES2715-CONJ3]|uniref:hypothetical protein n=1 Tax=Corynebacterium sp. ES2715-CONJ3 TaxID=2974028 RepID=UPI00216777E7|nr:hypothetical protein [Corynebacterium sp. ES2715-CONJ3]MCS4492148.1 hypothetical protein [Corynebacterium sp. ES2715-CONJ3]
MTTPTPNPSQNGTPIPNPHGAPMTPAPAKKKLSKAKIFLVIGLVLFIIGACSALLDSSDTPTAVSTTTVTTTVEVAPVEDAPVEDTPAKESASEETPEVEPQGRTVKAGESEFTCKDVPADVMESILLGDKDDDGANATVLEAQMVEGVDNLFVTANVDWYNAGDPVQVTFAVGNGGQGPIYSLSKGTNILFNWPYVEEAARVDASIAVRDCI